MLQRAIVPTRASGPTAMAALMSACVVVVVAMVAAINLALPELAASSLAPSSTELLWIVDAYILVFGCLLIPAGALADRLGRKGVLLTGLGIFIAGCLLSATAPVTPLLLAARAVTGLGAALVMPATLSLLLQVTPPARKPVAIATWSAATGAAGALGNLGGGLVLEWASWRGLFLVMAPLAAMLAVLVAGMAPRGERHASPSDPSGAALLTAAVFVVLLAIIEAPEQGWASPFTLGAVVAASILLATFVRRSLRRRHPMLDPRLFRIGPIRNGSLGVAAVFFGLFALFFVNAQYLQYAKGYSPLSTGLAILPLPATMVVVSRRSVALAGLLGLRLVVAAGMGTLALGIAALSFVTAATAYPSYAAALVLVGVGMGLSVPSLSTGIVTSLPPHSAGIGSGINSAAREVGAALGVAVVGTVLTSTFRDSVPAALGSEGDSIFQTLHHAAALGPSVREQTVGAFRGSMSIALRVVSGIVLVVGVVVTRRGAEPPARPSAP